MTKLLHFLLLVLLLAPIVFADETKEDPDALSPECQEILAELEADQKQHKADYKAKGKAYYNWKKYHDELNSDSYLNTDAPLMDSVKKCKSDRNPDSEKKLDIVVSTLKNNPTVKIKTEGHTDSTGSEEYNLGLSQRRSGAVQDYLISQGISEDRLTMEGKGETEPIASNDTKEGRAQNRRIEFIVTAK